MYNALKFLMRLGLKLYFKAIVSSGQGNVPSKGPVLLVSNHPNAFVDALVVAVNLKRPMYFLARGDVFNNPILARIFRFFNMLPIYRVSEGKENLGKNFDTFDAVEQALSGGHVVLIFGEGLCENNWDLRPQRKGAARIIQRAWQSKTLSNQTVVVPIGLTYEHFIGAGKMAMVNYGVPFNKQHINAEINTAGFVTEFNQNIHNQTEKLAYVNVQLQQHTAAHIAFRKHWQFAGKKSSVAYLHQPHKTTQPVSRPPFIGFDFVLLPLYWLISIVANVTTKGSVFYDSVSLGLFALLWPIYLLLLFFGVINLLQ